MIIGKLEEIIMGIVGFVMYVFTMSEINCTFSTSKLASLLPLPHELDCQVKLWTCQEDPPRVLQKFGKFDARKFLNIFYPQNHFFLGKMHYFWWSCFNPVGCNRGGPKPLEKFAKFTGGFGTQSWPPAHMHLHIYTHNFWSDSQKMCKITNFWSLFTNFLV